MKYISLMTGALVLSACAQPAPGGPNHAELCQQTVKNYAIFRDEGPAEKYAGLFTKDGLFELGGGVTKGREALLARQITAAQAAVWRHNMTSIEIGKDDSGLVGISRFIVFTGPHPDPASGAGKFTRQIIGDYLDKFVIEDGLCKIKSRRVNVVFDNKLNPAQPSQ